ncbi:translesion error-prone DNA polymerase V subunit UmuC (plasmid) [Marinobacter nanhaiticus D15-8W]|uniref:Y-family DNA polymerase n=2 Tax=Marinobacter TaxID=2742 RepID=N6WA98_9GAMM|nr:Y-family DNA polymerase [Marinobacter nanhaiticus D15-8W]BES73884.1 translesion error-prone DNA polymerase V subunit UmuC [Marinobacter nanhaiticus D15-8W]
MNTLQAFSPALEVYSIDEMFLQLDGLPEQGNDLGHRIKEKVWQHVRIPVGVGIAPTKTLAKLANRAAKTIPKCNGVCVLDEPHKWEWLLRRLPITEIWGIGKRMALRLADLGIQSGWELATAHPKTVRRRCNINVERTIEELNGRSCLELEELPPDKKQIYCTRSFGSRASTLQPIQEAVALYASRAVDKLRSQRGLVTTIHVFLHTSPFEPNYYSASTTAQLPYPTDDVRLVASLARRTVANLYKPGREYVKAGVGLIEIQGRRHHQFDCLSTGQSEQADRVMSALEAVKRRYGKGAVFLASQGVQQPWAMRQHHRSPEYTTQWSDLPAVS